MSGRWEEIERLYQAARELDAQGQSAFLDEACKGDAQLRGEVESLLSYEPAAARFLEEPATRTAAASLVTNGARSSSRAGEASLEPARTGRHPSFLWLVWAAAAVTLASFVYAGWVLADPQPQFGWSSAARRGIWYIETVDPVGPATHVLRRGDRLVSLNGDRNVSRAGPNPHRNLMSTGDEYGLVVLRDGQQHEYRLTVEAVPPDVGWRLTWFLIPLVWCAIGLFIGFVRPGHAAARLAFAAALATGLLFLHASITRPGPLWAPMHVVLGYHFFLLFPTGVSPGGAWMLGLYLMYGSGAVAMFVRYARWALNHLYGPAATTHLTAAYPMVFSISESLGLAAYCAALVGMLAVIPWNYRKLQDTDQRRRVHWVVLGSAIAIAGQLWWAVILVIERVAGPSGISRGIDLSEMTLAIPVTVAYAVVKHRVFDVRVVVRRGVQYLLAKRALQVLMAAPVIALVLTVVTHRNSTIIDLVSGTTAYLYWIGAAGLTLKFRRPVALWLDRKFFQEEYDREQVLFGLVDDLGKVGSMAELSQLVSARLEFALHPKVLYFWYRDAGGLTLDYSSGELIRHTHFPSSGRLLPQLEQQPEVVDISPESLAHLTAQEAAWLSGLGATILIPVTGSDERLAGVWMLGERKSETPYSASDRRLLQAIAKQTAVLRENLRLKAQVSEDQRLRREVYARLDRESFNLLKECPDCGKCFDNIAEHCDRDGQLLTASLPVERTIEDKYRIKQLIGRGGMGAVYEAHDLRLGRVVAVKIMMGRSFGQHTALRRFQREARAAASLDHPNIVNIFDFGRLEGQGAYLVMERIYGLTLRAKLDRDGPLAPPAAAEWFEQLLDGLAAAHAHGIIHRDLKPENIIRQERVSHLPVVKILDFGLAKFRPMDSAMNDGFTTGNFTAAGFVVGTIGYMSPEHLLGRDVDYRTDIFAVGVILAEALTGRKPFDADNHAALLQATLSHTYEIPCSSPESRVLNELVRRCLAKEPQQRPASVTALRQELIAALRACPSLDLTGGKAQSP